MAKLPDLDLPDEGVDDPTIELIDSVVSVVDVLEWIVAVKKLKQAKAWELSLRNNICSEVLQGITKKKTVIVENDDFKITAKYTVNLKADEEMLTEFEDDELLSVEELNVFSRKLTVSEKIHAIPKSFKIWEAITLKPGTPTLKVDRKESDDPDSDD